MLSVAVDGGGGAWQGAEGVAEACFGRRPVGQQHQNRSATTPASPVESGSMALVGPAYRTCVRLHSAVAEKGQHDAKLGGGC